MHVFTNEGMTVFWRGHALHEAGQVLYIPHGWLMMEASFGGTELIYRAPKTIMIMNELCIQNYDVCKALLQHDGVDVSRMDEVSKLMREELGK